MKYKNLILIVFILLILLGSASLIKGKKPIKKDTGRNPNKTAKVTKINPDDFYKLSQNKKAFVIDVHIPEQTHLPNTDAVIPYNEIVKNKNKLPKDKSTPILVYCRSGSMSAKAAKDIFNLGYSNVYDLQGGANAYKEQRVSVSLWPKTRDLGTVVYGDIAKTSFTLTNYTPLPLKITKIATSCGCTKASTEKEELQAYDSTLITVTFNPAVHKDDTDLGEIIRTIYIKTDNPNYPSLESTITAKVIKEKKEAKE